METPLCTTLYGAPMLACPRDGDRSIDPQLDVGMVPVIGELFFLFSIFLHSFFGSFSVKFMYSYSALPGLSEQFKCQKDFLWK